MFQNACFRIAVKVVKREECKITCICQNVNIFDYETTEFSCASIHAEQWRSKKLLFVCLKWLKLWSLHVRKKINKHFRSSKWWNIVCLENSDSKESISAGGAEFPCPKIEDWYKPWSHRSNCFSQNLYSIKRLLKVYWEAC